MELKVIELCIQASSNLANQEKTTEQETLMAGKFRFTFDYGTSTKAQIHSGRCCKPMTFDQKLALQKLGFDGVQFR